MAINVKQAVQRGNKCYFQYFRDGALWYATEAGEIFPVPVEDAGSATFNNEEKAMFLMRWMRKFSEDNNG